MEGAQKSVASAKRAEDPMAPKTEEGPERQELGSGHSVSTLREPRWRKAVIC